ncbi:sigma factor-like helix-turn-helix DNA-binding protein, partial [Bacteroidota bacterium]
SARALFFMSRFDKLKYAEIAEILDISIKTVETQIGRALKKLRENLSAAIMILLFILTWFL